MTNTCQLSINTEAYIKQYENILEQMAEKMYTAPISDSISGSFIVQMIPHHRGAIAMSENLLKYTTDIPLQNIALNIISSQEKSIKNMTAVYEKCEACINSREEVARYKANNQNIISCMIYEMSVACTDNSINANFIREMIPHHRGAVRMSENALGFPLCRQLVSLLEEIIVSQKEGIRKMQELLCQIEC